MNNEWVLPAGINLRLAEEGDEEFFRSLFCSARPELGLLPLPPAQLSQLMRQQYDLQQRGYRDQYPQLENWVIEMQSVSIGKIMLVHLQPAIHIIDFIIVPERRDRGVGHSVITALKAHNQDSNGSLSLQVDRQNINAKRFYQKLGFVVSQSSDTHEFLVWS